MATAQAAENYGYMSDAWPDTYNEGYIHQFQPKPTHKIYEQISSHGTTLEWSWRLEWSNRYDQTEPPIVNLIESQ